MSSTPKIFQSFSDQITIQDGRGLIIKNDAATQKILETENYYKLFNGYKRPFLDSTYAGPDEKYLANTSFDEVYSLYLFDRELRNIFIKYILIIENHIKSVLAYDFSSKYGYDNYLKVSNFETSVRTKEKKTDAQKIGEVSGMIADLNQTIAKQLSKNNDMFSHYMLHHGYVPLWVLVNTLTFGTVSIFYSRLKAKDQNDVGRYFNLKPKELENILKILGIFRNACAHDERLYKLKSKNPISTLPIHSAMHIPIDKSGCYVCGKNDLFSIVLIFKVMLTPEYFEEFYILLDKAMSNLASKLKVISISKIEKEMGFVPNWRDIRTVTIGSTPTLSTT